ncbi:MAG: hypothetical protein LBP60_07125 [Spirochaetaceae bacterium]|jgi:hypothetical protein|nr:hypothetical protein [Spirochaetaceae bacterium]
MKRVFLSIISIGLLLGMLGCLTTTSDFIYYDKELPPDKTAIVIVGGWGSWGRTLTIKSYNGIPIETGNRYLLPLGLAKFTVDADDVGTQNVGHMSITSGARIYDVEFAVNLEKSGNLETKEGYIHFFSFVHPSDGPWGITVTLYDVKGKYQSASFVQFRKDGELVYGSRYK